MGKNYIVLKNLTKNIIVSKFTYYKQGDQKKKASQNKTYN